MKSHPGVSWVASTAASRASLLDIALLHGDGKGTRQRDVTSKSAQTLRAKATLHAHGQSLNVLISLIKNRRSEGRCAPPGLLDVDEALP